MVLAETFGATGLGTEFFGGQWWLVGILLLLVFVAFLVAYKVNVDGIITFIILALLLIGGYQLFVINEQIVQTILFIIFMFVGYIAYRFVSK